MHLLVLYEKCIDDANMNLLVVGKVHFECKHEFASCMKNELRMQT